MELSGAGSVLVTSGSGYRSGWPYNIRIPNTKHGLSNLADSPYKVAGPFKVSTTPNHEGKNYNIQQMVPYDQ